MGRRVQQSAGEKQGGVANLTRAGMGRTKGVPNKMTRELKEMILAALDAAGGVEYLQRQAEANPSPFLSLVGKVLPLTLNAKHSGSITIQPPTQPTALDQ